MAVGVGVWQTAVRDSDGDGITDRVELAGWQIADGTVYRTDPAKSDSDADGLTDLEEAGPADTSKASDDAFIGFSDPLVVDTDGDQLSDAREVDAGLAPRVVDTDEDGLSDGYESDVVGSDPTLKDTDLDGFADGYEDANRESQGLDPIAFDEQVSRLTYATDFAKGALAGDLLREDSLAWLAGNLASGASTGIPVVGELIGGAADLRDAIGSAIKGDWVGSGFSAIGAVPGGDAIAVPGKAARFIARNPQLAAAAGALIAKASRIPDAIKTRAARQMWPNWDDLLQAGWDERGLLRLQEGRTDLRVLAETVLRKSHVRGVAAPPFADGPAGEQFLARLHGADTPGRDLQVRLSTSGCGTTCGSDMRIVDVLANGVAHESKVGFVPFSDFTQRQIQKDAWLVRTGQIKSAHWHFFTSSYSNTLGADQRVIDMLDSVGIPFTVHPAASLP